MLARAAEALARGASQLACTRWIPARNRRGIVSFTFDDIPKSAAHTGAQMLEAHGVQGTFYIAGGLVSGQDGETYATIEDLRRLNAYGHELGCHTFSHVKAPTLSRMGLVDECRRNQTFVQDALGDTRLASFAYPFGAVSLGSKFELQRRFSSCRGTSPGVNAGLVDLGLLKAERLYARRTTEGRVSALIDRARRTGGWLIFYTHDVTTSPTQWGATPELLSFALDHANEADLEILTVRNALPRVAYG